MLAQSKPQENFMADPERLESDRKRYRKTFYRKKPVPAHIRRNYPLKYHPIQAAGWASQARFNVIPSGRRSGKTEIFGKRKLVMKALQGSLFGDGRYFAGAPTQLQSKRIFWKDLKLLTPLSLQARPPSESELVIFLVNGSEIHVMGMDKPERIEGPPWDHGCLDEIGNMKPQTWPEHVRPALSDRLGTCDFIGVPEGRNHYYELYKEAEADTTGNWATWHWLSSDILPAEEIIQAKRDLDELTYRQEYEGSFVSFSGRCYYNFDELKHVGDWKRKYHDKRPLILALDFNESPGVASILQEIKEQPDYQRHIVGKTTTAVIGEIYIKRNSNTIKVCKKFIEQWGDHKGQVFLYGDSTGGAGGSAKVEGSDWDLVKKVLWPKFKDRLVYKIPPSNPRERVRVNSVNSRLMNTFGEVFFVVDHTCTNTIKDFEGVRVIEGGTGDIDKKRDLMLTHLTDAVGYYISREHPVRKYEKTGVKFWK
jgi:hypothetical protein